MNIKQKLTSAAVIGAMMAGVVAPASFAATTVNVRNNGALSTNLVGIVSLSKKSVKQKNSTVAVTSVKAKSNTGKNTSSFNTGGTNSITTGNARNNTTVIVNGGVNENTDDCGCVDPTTNATVSGNGAMSTNGVLVVNASSNSVYQSNSSVVVTSVSTSSNTGGNNSSFNTNGGGSTGTGAATNNVGVEVGGSANIN